MATHIIFLLLATLQIVKPEYIPPGPAYPCPSEKDNSLLFPCACVKGTDDGIHVLCENTGLAVLSVGLGNIAGLGLPIERLELRECKISRLFGPLFHRSTIRTLHIIDTPIETIDEYAFAGVNRTLQELHMRNTKLAEFPKDAFKILGNLSTLLIDGHVMTKLSKDMFAGSEAVGGLERLTISNGLISDIPPEALQNLKKLKFLDLHGNRLATLKRNQFKGLRDTEVLDISYNNITKLDGSHIGDLTKLGWCNVSHNLIGDMPRGMFARNTVLKVLHLDNNKLKKLDTNSFRGMRFLRRLFLQDNQISDIGRGTFAAVTRIGTVDLARNQLTKVDYQMFQQVKYAEVINLAENKITKIETQAFTDLYLAVVNVSHNALSNIEADSFINCHNMTLLDLSHNNLTEITKKAFDENSYALEFTVAYNHFTDFGQIPIQNMTGIKILNVSHNEITTVPKMAFPKLYELHTVDMSHNKLTDIFNAVYQNLFSLRFLNLSHNSLSTIKPAMFGTLPTVLELDLSHNALREVSRGSLSKLASCRRLDLSHNELVKLFHIPISLGELILSHNNLTEIPANTWPSMNALLRLDLSHNLLADNLADTSFSPLLTLQALDLSDNQLTKPPWQALSTLTSLQYLYLQNNNLTSLSKSAFGNLPTMFHLDLSNNQISSIGQQSFQGLQQLLKLHLSGNMLERIPNEAFKSLVALRHLDLSHNMLEKIDNKTNGLLDDCLSLESVDLSYNNIAFLTSKMFPSSPWVPYRLREVDLSHNQLAVLTLDVTKGTKTVKRMILKGNMINEIRSYVIGNLTSLETLDLSDNQLKDLQSRTADAKFYLPENITEMYLQNNNLQTIPIDAIKSSKKLTLLDLSNNDLTSFEPELVNKVKSGTDVLFAGNNLKCDCFVRPLKHYLNHLSPTNLKMDTKYKNITCMEPEALQNQELHTIDEDRLLCVGNTVTDDRIREYGNTGAAFDFEAEPDLAFRDVQYAQTSIYANWYVLATGDVADFYLYVRDDRNTLYYSNQLSYNLRSTTITIDKQFEASLRSGGRFEICIQAKTSSDVPRKWYQRQCQTIDGDFDRWPVKLSIDKRRLTRKKVKYSWFGNSVLGLVSDSILITMCIFMGVCFRRLADFD